jgi:hypothetical protein
MWNPFTTPVPVTAQSGPRNAAPYGFPLEHYEFPSEDGYHPEPAEDTLPTHAEGYTYNPLPDWNRAPSLAAQTPIMETNGYESSGVTPPSGKPSSDPVLMPVGPNTGADTSPAWTGENTALRRSTPGYAGPNSSGMDQATAVAFAYAASVQAQYSNEAAVASLIAAV